MVGHDAPPDQAIALSVMVVKGIAYNLGYPVVSQKTLSTARVLIGFNHLVQLHRLAVS